MVFDNKTKAHLL